MKPNDKVYILKKSAGRTLDVVKQYNDLEMEHIMLPNGKFQRAIVGYYRGQVGNTRYHKTYLLGYRSQPNKTSQDGDFYHEGDFIPYYQPPFITLEEITIWK